MTKTIGMLWGGELSPCQYFGMFNAKMRQQNHLVQDALDKLEQTLGENQKELFHIPSQCTFCKSQADKDPQSTLGKFEVLLPNTSLKATLGFVIPKTVSCPKNSLSNKCCIN